MTTAADRLLEEPLPPISAEAAARVSEQVFGVVGDPTPLASERDRNFLIDGREGAFVLKFAHPAEGADVLSMQAEALDHIRRVDPDVPVPRTRPTVEGPLVGLHVLDGEQIPVRMVSFLPGATLRQGISSSALRGSIVTTLARLQHALRGFFHPAAGRVLLWDLSHVPALRSKVHHVDDGQRSLIEDWLARFDQVVAPRLPELRAQAIHNDFNPENLLADADDPDRVGGIIDFGDMVHGPLVVDLAVAVAYQLLGDDDPADVIPEMAAGFNARSPLEPAEMEVLPELVTGRLVQSVVIGDWRARHHADNTDYILSYSESIRRALQRLSEVDPDETVRLVKQRCLRPGTGRRGSEAELLERRDRRLGPGLRLSYANPVHVESAEGVWIVDAAGDRYLDAYNNVPHVGHSHPTVTAAIAGRAAVLNTNTRYLVDDVVAYADRLAGMFPDELEVVLFANSGSEANDLAWRIATTVTGQRGFVVTEHAYHGSTYLTMATSPEELGRENLEPWVATVPAPDTRMGRDPETSDRYAGFVDEAIEALDGIGFRPAAFACDTIFSSDGIFDAPTGYLRSVAERIRSAGGFFIADEVQAGFGRVGERLWGFAERDVVPDIVTLGKPMGNGHPVAAVVTTRAVAQAFSQRGYYFSTFAGNSVSAAAGMAVLDVMESEHLPARAERVGAYLRSALVDLADLFPIVDDVRGAGLFVGVELASEQSPDPAAARRVVEQMRERHVLIGSTGPHHNVLKIRPPLAFDESHADIVVSTLGVVLSELA